MMTPKQRKALDRELAKVRIQFAAAALTGIAARYDTNNLISPKDAEKSVVREAWDMAEKMVNARLSWLESVLMPTDEEEGNGCPN